MVGTFARQVPLRAHLPVAADPLPTVHALLAEAMDLEPVPHLLIQEMMEAAYPGLRALPLRVQSPRRRRRNRRGRRAGPRFRPGPATLAAAREEDVLLLVLQSGSRRTLHWYLRADRFDPAAAERLLTTYQAALFARLAGVAPSS